MSFSLNCKSLIPQIISFYFLLFILFCFHFNFYLFIYVLLLDANRLKRVVFFINKASIFNLFKKRYLDDFDVFGNGLFIHPSLPTAGISCF